MQLIQKGVEHAKTQATSCELVQRKPVSKQEQRAQGGESAHHPKLDDMGKSSERLALPHHVAELYVHLI